MTSVSTRFSLAFVAALPLFAGCGHGEDVRQNAPPHGESACAHPMADYYAYHNDQGIVHDMSIADIHFVPHSADLSGTGVARLERLAELLADAGGTVYYDTAMADRELVDRRLETAHAFLAECRAGRHEVAVALGAAGGPGMGFREAVAGAAIAQQPEKRERAYDFSKIGQTTGGR